MFRWNLQRRYLLVVSNLSFEFYADIFMEKIWLHESHIETYISFKRLYYMEFMKLLELKNSVCF